MCAWRGTLVGVSPTARNCQKVGTKEIRIIEWGTVTYTEMYATHHKAYAKKNRTLVLVQKGFKNGIDGEARGKVLG